VASRRFAGDRAGHTRRGCLMLIAFEGGEGTGKSTQAALLAVRIGAVLTNEPGATEVGAAIRRLLLSTDTDVDPRAEALLMAADRAQHVAAVVAPALAGGRHVVTDRYLYSSLAYQGFGRGLDLDAVRALSSFAGAPEADLVVLLTVPPQVRARRLAGELDRFESDEAYLGRVEEGFLALAKADPDRWLVLEGDGPVEDVAARVWDVVSTRLPA
jgi:dTMP kinase